MDLTIKTENLGSGDQSWLGSAHGTDAGDPITLDTSTFVANTHYPDGYFKSGIPLGKITASGLYGPYDNAAVDGREVLAGLLFTSIDAPDANTTDVQGVLFWHGEVVEALLPIAVDAAGKADVAGRIFFK